jgi:2-polyprenyl-3-methyl-5-hydroxy-6-metoxy-1,4-benzoquinol methylase
VNEPSGIPETGSTRYDAIADWYADWVGSDLTADDPFFPTVEALMGSVAGQRVCDLACGQGRVARCLAERGARVLGIDSSAGLLDIARERERLQPRGIDFRVDDARTLQSVADASVDGVLCFQALMDIPDLGPTIRSVARILRPGGWFVFSILHPCYHAPRSDEVPSPEGWLRLIGSYFHEGHCTFEHRTGPPGKVGLYHRMLSTYLNTLAESGFVLERMSEPPATPTLAASRPIWAEVPAMLVVRCCKRTAAVDPSAPDA